MPLLPCTRSSASAYRWSVRRSSPSSTTFPIVPGFRRAANWLALCGCIRGRWRRTGNRTDAGRARRPRPNAASKATTPSSNNPCRHPQAAAGPAADATHRGGSRASFRSIVGICNDSPQRAGDRLARLTRLDGDLLSAHGRAADTWSSLAGSVGERRRPPLGSLTSRTGPCASRRLRAGHATIAQDAHGLVQSAVDVLMRVSGRSAASRRGDSLCQHPSRGHIPGTAAEFPHATYPS